LQIDFRLRQSHHRVNGAERVKEVKRMRRVIAIAVIAEAVLVAIVLHSEIIEFIHTHPWWHSALAAIPEVAAPILGVLELLHSREANRLRAEANDHRDRANLLQEGQNKSVAEIAQLQRKNAELARN
jgi:Ni/Fe-hydrogenase subunit HybB-like protein